MKLRLYGIEVVRALAVLAVIFLNFAVAAPASAAATAFVVDDAASWCGTPADGGDDTHFTCAACRLDTGIDVPPRVTLAERVAVTLDRDEPSAVVPPAAHLVATPPARGPPLI